MQPYLVTRDTLVQRLYTEHAGYWQANGDAGENAAQLDTGWRGYFEGNTLHITKEERAVLIVRWCAQRQQTLSA